MQLVPLQGSVLGGLRSELIEELRVLVKHMVVAEDLHRTALEKIDEAIGEKVNRTRPIERIARKIDQNPVKLTIKYAQFISRITRFIHSPPGTAYMEQIQKFQKTYPKSVLPEMLKLSTEARCRERVEKMALIVADNCLWHNVRIEKLRKKLEEKEAQLHKPSGVLPCNVCVECSEDRKRLELQVRDSRRAEVLARDLWVETNERKIEEKTTAELVGTYLLGATLGAAAGGAAAAMGNSGLTLDSMAAGAQVGPNVVNTAKGVVTGDPQIIDQTNSYKLHFRSLSERIKYAFQPESSGRIGRIVKPLLYTDASSRTVGRVVIRLEEEVTLYFNSKAYFRIEPMVYWQFCQHLGKQVLESRLPPNECLDIFFQLETGLFFPENGPPIMGVVDERLAFCSDRLKKMCEKLKTEVKEIPPAVVNSAKGRADYSLGAPV